ncbi:MAG: hypothetical protein ISS48_04605 [Candidatus Aenigmarchaeota archaeon]|nr:hypothetical protein [Candidatus Aenigmarchaeota archaeon]
MAQPTKYPYADVIDVMGTYRYPTRSGNILFYCIVFPSYKPGIRDVPVYLPELLERNEELTKDLSLLGLAVALFWGERNVDIVSSLPRPDESDNPWLGNGSTVSGTYFNGQKMQLRPSGMVVNSCDAGAQIANGLLDFRRTRGYKEIYEQLAFGEEWPNLSPMVDMGRVRIVNFNKSKELEVVEES